MHSGPKGLRPREREMNKRTTVTGAVVSFAGIDTIQADPGDTIEWVDANKARGPFSIWVPDERVFGKCLVADHVTLPFSAVVLGSVPPGIYEYAIYNHNTGHFVVSRSHPKIEIPKP